VGTLARPAPACSRPGPARSRPARAPEPGAKKEITPGLEQERVAFKPEFARTAPAGRAHHEAQIEELGASFALEEAIAAAERAPAFSLPAARGK